MVQQVDFSLAASEPDRSRNRSGAVPLKFLSPASFWLPDHIVPTSWAEHAPFAFWLIDVLRPRCFVELGAHYGYSYLAFCKAVKELGLPTECFAVDTWEGDVHAGFYGEEVWEQLVAANDGRFGAFSRLVRSTFDEALQHFPDSGIDLLHIDGRHYYQDVRHDFESWLPKMSSRGVVLFHDTNVREWGFGVFQLWEELIRTYPGFNFLHCQGLGILGVGTEFPPALQGLFAAGRSAASAAPTRRVYTRLGRGVADYIAAATVTERTGMLEAKLTEAQEALGWAQSERVRLEGLLAEHRRQTVALEAEVRSQAAELSLPLAAVTELTQAAVAELTQAAHRLMAERRCLRAELGAVTRDRDGLRADAQRTQALLHGIRGSISWQLTKPLRLVGRLFPGPATALRRMLRFAWRLLSVQALRRSAQRRLLHDDRQRIQSVGLFDPDFYAASILTMGLGSTDPLTHFLLANGRDTGDPHPLFDTRWYLARNPDVDSSGVNPLLHYLLRGGFEGRDPNPFFDSDWYYAQNPDVAQAGINPLVHYLRSGGKEGRDPSPAFVSSDYVSQHPEIQDTDETPLGQFLRRR